MMECEINKARGSKNKAQWLNSASKTLLAATARS
jgi:hypothetical protein